MLHIAFQLNNAFKKFNAIRISLLTGPCESFRLNLLLLIQLFYMQTEKKPNDLPGFICTHDHCIKMDTPPEALTEEIKLANPIHEKPLNDQGESQ